jgi:sortase A
MTRGGHFLRWTERLLWWTGALLLGWCAATLVEARVYQVFAGRRLDQARQDAAERVSENPTPSARSSGRPMPGGLIGRLEIPRIGLSVIVLEGDNSWDLKVGVGHIPGTPMPWEQGNSAFAGHRDTFLRPLRGVRDGDAVELATERETYHYVVDSVQIVSPIEVGVLAPSASPFLTIVTCYPFSYVGNAPKRFVVRARRVSG